MPKRQHKAAIDSDEEEPQHSQASSKRARTADNSEDEDAPRTRARRTREKRPANGKTNGKGKARATESDEDERSEEEDEDGQDSQPREELDDEEFERIHGEKLEVHLANRRKVAGGVAEHGIIEYIEMHQFMCHKYLRFTFGPQINFIIGHNGSGKSAVLSAITVALGGKATSTGRGNGLKSFIREGQGSSEVTIHIKNQGEEAFKPKEYGKTIVITRKFTKEGSSSWKIKSKDNKVISTKKEELAAICDHMNIQVDNPMNVLTQDSARQFLSASQPQDKYKFFLRGTQLSQLSDEYDICMTNITQTAKLLLVKKEALPDLRARLREVTARYDEAAKAREQKRRVDDLKKELAWSHVSAKEAEMEKKTEEVAKLARRLPEIEKRVQLAQVEFDAATKQVTKFEQEINDLEGVDDLNVRKTELQDEMRANKTRLMDLNNDLKQIDASTLAINKQIEGLEKSMGEEARRMAVNTQGKQEETQRKLEGARTNISSLEAEIGELIRERKDKGTTAESREAQGRELERKLKDLQDTIGNCEATISRAKQMEKDALVPYGKDIKHVLEKIKTMRWHGELPLGPLGMYVKAKDPRTWGELLRNQLGNYLLAFAVTDARDRPQLKQLLSNYGNPRTTILIYQQDLFDYRSGEPPEHLLTVLRALEITDPYVMRILINQAHIETQILSVTRFEAQQTLQTLRGGSAWTNDKMAVRVFPEGGVFSSTLNFRPMGGAMSLLLTGRDGATEVQHISGQKAEAEAEYNSINGQVRQLKAEYVECRQAIDKINKQEDSLQRQLRNAKVEFANLQEEANEELPAGLAGFEDAKQEAEREKASFFEQFTAISTQKGAVDEAQKQLLYQMNDIKALLNDFEDKRASITKKAEDAVEARMNAQNTMNHYRAKCTEEKRKVEVAEAAAKLLEEEFASWRKKALEYCTQVPNPRKTEEVQRHLDSVQKALKEREKVQGASVDDLAQEVNKAKVNYDKAQTELKQMSTLNKQLKASLLIRLNKWQEFRRHIALRCKHVFMFHLSQRGYYGKILFNHEHGTLTLRVQTDDQLQTQGTRDKDPRSLSGGEKSFSTICLLLSLWECIGCPLRCLDEFDVFMDAVNRRISMKMMIDTANTSDKKQYILITPQDMTNVTLGPSVRVLRMTDPERGNGTLPFGAS
ncbi:hypothetical protein GALMADRAFT_238908 [Galerina marginata CBS 339.88]|uniref:RecF/RecN/SMC N-terminal domain-containing protein n=1 Tax=Galerina marginata (strain CBS 339.88) TaxID=685588 RepID=A0A067TIW9_GALM3|nr:hypothetical protein GALMADRAFT_238908 [Galerina marginata CBS 339.88]